jgi:hypothetical protein
VGKLEGKRPLGRPRRRWVDNIKIDLREIGRYGMEWIDLAQDRDQWKTLFHIILGISCISTQLADFQEGLSSVELVEFGLSPSGMNVEMWVYDKKVLWRIIGPKRLESINTRNDIFMVLNTRSTIVWDMTLTAYYDCRKIFQIIIKCSARIAPCLTAITVSLGCRNLNG